MRSMSVMRAFTAKRGVTVRPLVALAVAMAMFLQPLAAVISPASVSTALAQTTPPRKADTRAPGSSTTTTATVSGATEATAVSPASATAPDLAAAMDINTGPCVPNSATACLVPNGVSLGTSDPLGTQVFTAANFSTPVGFLTAGGNFAAISSGNASWAPNANTSGSTTQVLNGLKTNQGNDLVQLTLTVMVPTDGTGKRSTYWAVDWKFLSEEFPEWVGSQYNDTFLIERNQSIFQVTGSGSASAVTNTGNNVVSDPSGRLISVNTSGTLPSVMNAAYAAGTTYDGATKTLTTVWPVPAAPATQMTLVFSVMDLGDSLWDSTVFLDNFRFLFSDQPPVTLPARIDIPVLWCSMAPGASTSGLTSALTPVSDQIYNNNALAETLANPYSAAAESVSVTSAASNVHFISAGPPVTIVDDRVDVDTAGNPFPGYVVLPDAPPDPPNGKLFGGDNGADRDHVFSQCRNAWPASVANTGIVAVQVTGLEFLDSNGKASVASGYQSSGIPQQLDPVSQLKSAGVLLTPSFTNKDLAHELAHSLSLFHGDGFDNHPKDGILDGNEGTPASPTDESGLDTAPHQNLMHPSSGSTGLLITPELSAVCGQGTRVRRQTLIIPNAQISSSGAPEVVCNPATASIAKVGAASATPGFRANIAEGVPTVAPAGGALGTGAVTPDYTRVQSLGVVINPPTDTTFQTTSLFANLPLLPTNLTGLSVYLLLDADQNAGTGGDPQTIGAGWPSANGIELAARADLSYDAANGKWLATPHVYLFSGSTFGSELTGGISARVTTEGVAVDGPAGAASLATVGHSVVISVPTSIVSIGSVAPLRAVTQTPQGGDDKSATLPLTPAPLPTCQVTPGVLPAGGSGAVQASGLSSSTAAQAIFEGAAVSASGTTNGSGAVSLQFTLPAGAPSGNRTIIVTAGASAAYCQVVVDRAPAIDLPPTGAVRTITPNTPLSFTVQATDPDLGGAVALGMVGAPSGASLTCPTAAKTTACTFSWTPSSTGTYIVTFTAVDQYGYGANPLPVVIVVDAQPPSSTAAISPAKNANGWNNSDVTVTISATDDQAVFSITYSATGANPIPLTQAPGGGQVRDGDPVGATLTFNNGVASTSFKITKEGKTTVKFHATDIAGGSDSDHTLEVWLDKTKPTTTLTSPTEGAQYIIGQPVTVSYTCSDPAPSAADPAADPAALVASGVATCTSTVPSGTPVDTSTVGVKTFATTTLSATDKAGNSTTSAVSVSYVVTYKVCLLYDPVKPQNVGSTYAIKVQICDWNNNNLSSPDITLHAVDIVFPSTGAVYDAGNANLGNNFRYDPTLRGGGYIFNVDTKALSAGTWYLEFKAGTVDPVVHRAEFRLK